MRYMLDTNIIAYAKNNRLQDRLSITESLIGILPQTMTLEEAREERL